jgi:hypothetical protein
VTPAGDQPVLAARTEASSLWTRPVRLIIFGVVAVASVLALAFGAVNARNVTFNLLVDEGGTTGIPRFSRERVADIWRTMWDNAPVFGSVDLVRMTILIGGTAFVLAGLALVYLALVPSRAEWVSDLSGETDHSTHRD